MIQVLLRLEAGTDRWRIEVHSNPDGWSKEWIRPLTDADLATITNLPEALRTWTGVLGCLTHGSPFMLTLPLQKQVGQVIFDRLFGGARLRSHLDRIDQRSRAEPRPVQYLLDVDEANPILAGLPLELAYDSQSQQFFFNRPDRPVFRCASSADAQDLKLTRGARILVVTAHVDGRQPDSRQLRGHAQALLDLLAKAGFTTEWLADASPATLEKRLRQGEPIDVLYIVGHGLDDPDHCGALLLREGILTGHSLGKWLEEARSRGKGISVVMLCACSSAVPGPEAGTAGMAQWLSGRERARAAIGFRGPVAVEWALRFFDRLFGNICQETGLENAYAAARLDADQSDPQWALPLLFSRPRDLWKVGVEEEQQRGHQPVFVEIIRQTLQERDEELRSASEKMAEQDYESARRIYEKAAGRLQALEATTPGDHDVASLVARSQLGLVLALLSLHEGSEQVREKLSVIQPAALSSRGRTLLSQAWTSIGDTERAEAVLPEKPYDAETERQVDVARQLLSLRRGLVPQLLLPDPVVLLAAAFHFATQGQLPVALHMAERALEQSSDHGLLNFSIVDLLTRMLRSSVYEFPPAQEFLPRDVWPKVMRLVQDGQQRLSTLPLPALLQDALEELKAIFGDLLQDKASPLVSGTRRERPAQLLAKQGKLEEALSATQPSSHPWLQALERASLCLIAGQPARARDEALGIDRCHPGKLPVEHLLASAFLALKQPDAAVPLARRVFASLPGGGHLHLLVECLLACNRHDAAQQAWQLLEQDEQHESPWELRTRAFAGEHVDLAQALKLWDQYLAMRPQEAIAWIHVAGLRFLVGEYNNAAECAWRGVECAPPGALPAMQLAIAADFILSDNDWAPSERRCHAEHIIERIQRDFPDDPHAQKVALDLGLALQDQRALSRVRLDLLEQHGLVRSGKSIDELKEFLEQHRQGQDAVAWLYRAGLWPYGSLSIGPAELTRRAFAARTAQEPLLATPVHSLSCAVPPLSKIRLLTGPLELFLLERLGLLPNLKQALQPAGRLVLFADTAELISREFLSQNASARQAEEQAPTDDRDAAARVLACRELARRAQEVQRFVAEGLRDKWIESGLEWPTVELPLRGRGGSFFQEVWERALGYRAAMVADPGLHLLSVDFLTSSLFGGGDFVRLWLQFLQPDRDAFVRLAEPMSETAVRIVTLPQIVVQLSNDDAVLQTRLRLLVELGFADALRTSDLLWASQELGLLARVERVAWLPHEAPSRSPSAPLPEQETIHPGQAMAIAHVAELYPAGIVHAFCLKGEQRPSLDVLEAMTVTLFERLQAMPGPALELACLSLSRQVVPRYQDAVISSEKEGMISISELSLVGQLWTVMWKWAQTDERRRAALSRAVTTQLCTIDQNTWPRSPDWRHIAALLLGCVDEVSADLAILSANWDIRPLEQRTVSAAFDKDPRNWEEVFQQAAQALDREEMPASDGTTGTWWITLQQGERSVRYELPAEAVLLRAKPSTLANLGRELALESAARDGRTYSLLTELSSQPEDLECRRDLARITTDAPWRLMRQSPLWLLRWPAMARMPDSPLPSTIDELRAMLCEPGQLLKSPDLALLQERINAGAPWAAWPGLIEQASLVPGVIGATALRAFLEPPYTTSWVQGILARLARPQDHPAARVARDLLCLSFAASDRPIIHIQDSQEIDIKKELPCLMERSLRDAIDRQTTSVADEDAVFADHEPGLLRLCARVISALAWPRSLEIRDGIWLSYRLYQWYVAQFITLSRDERIASLRELAPAYPSAVPASDAPLELFHPFRLGPEGTQYRLLTLLYAVMLGASLSRHIATGSGSNQSEPQPYCATNSSLESLLAGLAGRPLTAAECQMQAQALTHAPSALGWSQGDPLSVPELALAALLSRRQQAFGEMPLPTRLEWIKRLPQSPQDPDAASWSMVDTILISASLAGPNIHPDERSLLLARSQLLLQHGTSWVPERYQRLIVRALWICRIRLYEAGEQSLQEELRTIFTGMIDPDLARDLFPHYLVAVAEVALESLESETHRVLQLVQARGEDLSPWIQAIGQVIQSGKPEAQRRASELLPKLSQQATPSP